MLIGPNDFEVEDVLEESIYEEVENYYSDDLVDLVQNVAWE
ncbi:MAG TPA: hypothetical protein VM325_15225 [Alphaproteobacteria bacterium]|nr:hypothetical protein [Alphaproteobacteria bacterium]